MPIFSEGPANFYSTGHAMTTCGSDAGITLSERLVFGFPATGIHINNTCADKLYFNLRTSATTDLDGYVPGAGSLLLNPLPPFTGISLKTTSTTTTAGVPLARPQVRVVAWGG